MFRQNGVFLFCFSFIDLGMDNSIRYSMQMVRNWHKK